MESLGGRRREIRIQGSWRRGEGREDVVGANESEPCEDVMRAWGGRSLSPTQNPISGRVGPDGAIAVAQIVGGGDGGAIWSEDATDDVAA